MRRFFAALLTFITVSCTPAAAPPEPAAPTPATPPQPASESTPAPRRHRIPEVEALVTTARRRLAEILASPVRDPAQLELTRGLAARAVALDAGDAEAHLVLALVDRASQDYASALASFDRARALDADLFEAHAGAAALRLQLRRFDAAASAYEDAIRARPKDYAARVGLAIARRGALDGGDDASWVARFEAARQAITDAISLAPERPEAYLSAGLLALDHGTRHSQPLEAERAILEAKISLEKFLALAGASPRLARQRRIAEERLSDIRGATECVFHSPELERRKREEESRRKQQLVEDLLVE